MRTTENASFAGSWETTGSTGGGRRPVRWSSVGFWRSFRVQNGWPGRNGRFSANRVEKARRQRPAQRSVSFKKTRGPSAVDAVRRPISLGRCRSARAPKPGGTPSTGRARGPGSTGEAPEAWGWRHHAERSGGKKARATHGPARQARRGHGAAASSGASSGGGGGKKRPAGGGGGTKFVPGVSVPPVDKPEASKQQDRAGSAGTRQKRGRATTCRREPTRRATAAGPGHSPQGTGDTGQSRAAEDAASGGCKRGGQKTVADAVSTGLQVESEVRFGPSREFLSHKVL